MDELAARLSLASQEHPAGRVDLTGGTSFVEAHRERGFSDGDVSDLFHENTKFDRRYLARSAATEDDLHEEFSVIEQDYYGHESISLPGPEPVECDLTTALDGRRSTRSFDDRGVSRQTLGTLLGHTVAPSAEAHEGDIPETFRPYPSAGGLYPVEVYLVVREGTDIQPGTYYYSPRDHALRVLATGETDTGVADCFMDEPFARGVVADAPVTIVLTGALSRIKAKYGPVGYRFALFEAGHLAQNLLLAASPLGLGGVPLGSFLDDELDRFLGIEGVNESALYPIALGYQQ
ncbi:SagB/ThcOx family dehydrogenase [Haloarcula amylolytica]|uniref:SagB/ThcOx family dehydrogenase n=1 Tax=Haloarcula amylolytica TaxID=396317 RepID=UPI003C779EF6